jgi:hypothetical protein
LDGKDLWTTSELTKSNYDLGTQYAGIFEVVARTSNSIAINGGGPALDYRTGGRKWDALLITSARVNEHAGYAELMHDLDVILATL